MGQRYGMVSAVNGASVRRERYEAFAAALILALPLMLMALWHLCNHGLPNDDAANYAQTSVEISQQFHKGPEAGAIAMMGVRGWRPILFPAMAVPFLLLTGGDIVAACAATQLLIYIALALYLYGLARQCSAGRLAAAASAACIVTVPAIATYSEVFYSEPVWLLFSAACVFHLIRSRFFYDVPNAFAAGVAAGLMVATRPAESVVVLLSVISFAIAAGIKSKTLTFHSVTAGVCLFALPSAVLAASVWVQAIHRPVIWGVCLLAICGAVLLARRYNPALLGFFAGLVGTACFWWADYMRKLYEWVYTTSFGEMAHVTDRRSAVHPLQTLVTMIGSYGKVQMSIVAILAVGAAVFAVRRRVGLRQEAEDSAAALNLRVLLWGAAAPIVLFGLLYASSGTGDPRRILVPLVLFMMGLFVLADRLRWGVAVPLCLALVQCVLLGEVVSGASRSASFEGFGAMQAPHRDADRNLDTARLLARYVPKDSLVAIYTMALFQQPARVYEPAALKLAALETGSPIQLGYLWDSADYNETIRRLETSGYRFLLLDSLPTASDSASHMPYVKFTAELLRRVEAGAVSATQLHEIARFSLGGREHTLFSIAPGSPVLGDNAAFNVHGAEPIASAAQKGYPAENLNDGTDAAFGSEEGKTDVYAAIAFPTPRVIHRLRIRLFTPAGRPHLRNIRIVCAASSSPNGPVWEFVPARLAGAKQYTRVLTIPALPDMSEVDVEIDPHAAATPKLVWGFACLRSQGDLPNYLPVGTGVYVRELGVD